MAGEAPFNDGQGLIRFIRGNTRRGKDTMIVSEGPEGSGKSTTTDNLVLQLDHAFNLQADPIMNMSQLLDVLLEARKGRIYVLDEAINIFHNQDWATWEAKALSKVIRQMRTMRSTWFLNVPDFAGLHPYVRDYRTRIRLYHPPVYDEDGMGNGPSQVLWKTERFGFKEQEVTSRWQYLFDLEVPSLDNHPQWKGYETRKDDNFRELIEDMMRRKTAEQEKETKRAKKTAKNAAAAATPPILRIGGHEKPNPGDEE